MAKKLYYHATDPNNLGSILGRGLVKGVDGCVYLTEKPEEACRFVAFRGYSEALVIEVMLDEADVQESFDHNPNFFKCRAWYIESDIRKEQMTNFWTYTINVGRQPTTYVGK